MRGHQKSGLDKDGKSNKKFYNIQDRTQKDSKFVQVFHYKPNV